jgi:hypothetical protein
VLKIVNLVESIKKCLFMPEINFTSHLSFTIKTKHMQLWPQRERESVCALIINFQNIHLRNLICGGPKGMSMNGIKWKTAATHLKAINQHEVLTEQAQILRESCEWVNKFAAQCRHTHTHLERERES